MAKLVTRYVDALLDLTEENGTLEETLGQAGTVLDVLDDDEVMGYLTNPHIADEAKQGLIDKVLGANPSTLRAILHLMIRKSRELFMVPMLQGFIEEANRRLGRIEARVVSATELDDEAVESLRRVLEKQTDKVVTLHAEVDPDVIGGFYILIEGYIYDATIRSELHQIRERLKRGGQYASSS